ncbi:hypothetical protein BD410DRAFT_843500 [Rickenella mellea]|uniref:SET domain-containing protein n=1 Tax=Rickenella mellea TaxID=50990 RepID=A0A4Y7PST2_9AGAM|nr:hypothetical protein BD410DRAFT_843500 [Rickenella mellea]
MLCVHGDQHNYSGIGLSITPSYIRHDCLGNCSRAVIGDVVIYRASRDIGSGAPIFVPYFPAWMEVEERQGRLSCYDIYCICFLCQSQMGDKNYHDERLAAVGALFGTLPTTEDILQNPPKAIQELEELCTHLERTYVDHPTIQPRFHSAGKFALLGTCYQLLGNREKQLESSLRGLSALGFDAKVDAIGHLFIMRHGHYDRENVAKLAEMQASSLQADGLVTQAATWRLLAGKALDIRFGHWSFTDYSIFGRERPKDTSNTD